MKSLLKSSIVGAASILVAACGDDQSGRANPMTPVYFVEGNAIALEDGAFERENGTVSLLVSKSGDLNGDAVSDKAVILVHNSRGSGVFYYLNALLDDGEGGLELAGEVFLGDRIRFDFVDIYGASSVSRLTGDPVQPDDHGQLVVGYYIHGPGQAYAESPGIYVTQYWRVEDAKLVSVEDD